METENINSPSNHQIGSPKLTITRAINAARRINRKGNGVSFWDYDMDISVAFKRNCRRKRVFSISQR